MSQGDEGTIPRDPSIWSAIGKEPPIPPQPAEPEVVTDDSEDVEAEIDETVGEISPWDSVDIALEGWQYRVWDKWIGNDPHTADLLLDVLHQYDPSATMAKEKSKTEPDSPDTVYAFHFSLYGSPDGLMDAVTAINTAFLALDNYKVVAGDAKAYVTYKDGREQTIKIPTKGGTDIDEALSWAVDSFAKSIGSKGEEVTTKRCDACKRGKHCLSKTPGCECGCQTYRPEYDTRPSMERLYPADEETTALEEEITKLEEEVKTWHPDLSYRGSPMGVSIAQTD